MMQANRSYNGNGYINGMNHCMNNDRQQECGCVSNLGNMSQGQLMDWINQCSFALNDVLLYLDTHPCDQEALSYFEHFHKIRQEALKEYGKRFSPLTLDSITGCKEQWDWVYGKWPWEGGNC